MRAFLLVLFVNSAFEHAVSALCSESAHVKFRTFIKKVDSDPGISFRLNWRNPFSSIAIVIANNFIWLIVTKFIDFGQRANKFPPTAQAAKSLILQA